MNIKFEDPEDRCAEFGLHDGFFNALVLIDSKKYYLQCCAEDLEDLDDLAASGYDDGICGDVNSELAELIGWSGVLCCLEQAIAQFAKDNKNE